MTSQEQSTRPPPSRPPPSQPSNNNYQHYYPTTSSSSSASFRGCCCCLFLLFSFLALLVLAIVLVIILAVKPKKPQFDLQQVGVQYMGITAPNPTSAMTTTADPNPNPTTTASLSLNIRMLFTAVNPNKVGIKYGESRFSVMYRGIPLGKASVPGFYQDAHSVRQVVATIAVDRVNLLQADAADLIRDASLNDRVELRVLGDVGAKIRVLNFDSPGVQKFRKEDMQLSGTEAFMRRSNSLQRAEQRAREESERLRQQEREKIAEKRRRDLTLRARVSAKTEEKKLELLFLQWSEHHRKLCNFIRTKTEPPIYYLLKKPLEEDATAVEQRKEQAFEEWKAARREELTEYQKQIEEQYLANVEKDLERWQNARNRKANSDMSNLQETMDKELDTHRLEHGPKRTKIPSGSNNEEEDDVEDINVGEDDMMDDVLDVDDNSRRDDETTRADMADNASPNAEKTD